MAHYYFQLSDGKEVLKTRQGARAPRQCRGARLRNAHKLIEKHGRMGNMMRWREQLNGDCPKRDGRLNDRCDLICPDLPKVV
jgi:hypothetical protein